MDPQLFAHWNDRCKSAHGHQCDRKGDPQQRVLGRPKWLIDTKTSSLVPAPSDTTYVALSYVWGQVESLQSTKSNIEQLCRPWSLLRDAVVVRIPPTIRDAIQAVRLLGERYLRVNSLCIIQDDEQTKKEQIMQMHAIYAGASITIVAAQGNEADLVCLAFPAALGHENSFRIISTSPTARFFMNAYSPSIQTRRRLGTTEDGPFKSSSFLKTFSSSNATVSDGNAVPARGIKTSKARKIEVRLQIDIGRNACGTKHILICANMEIFYNTTTRGSSHSKKTHYMHFPALLPG
jgi:hypothetical protein